MFMPAVHGGRQAAQRAGVIDILLFCSRLAALLRLLTAASASRSLLLSPRRSMEVVAEWRTVDYVFPSRLTRESALLTGDFIPNNVVVLDVDACREGE